jgi:hypothetical protein
MASGQVVGLIYQIVPPASGYATPSRRAGGSSPVENIPVWLFDASTTESLDFYGQMTGAYSNGGITIQIKWSSVDQTTGNVKWNAAFRRVADDAEDLDVSQTYDFNTVTATTTNVPGEVDYTTITFTNGADMDSVVAGDMFIVRLQRDANNAADTMTNDAQLHYIVIQET